MLGETVQKAEKADDLEKENDELREKLERQEEEWIENAVADAVTDGRIGADQKDIYKNILKANFKDGMTALKALKPKRLLKDKLESTAAGEGESPWQKRQREIEANRKK